METITIAYDADMAKINDKLEILKTTLKEVGDKKIRTSYNLFGFIPLWSTMISIVQ